MPTKTGTPQLPARLAGPAAPSAQHNAQFRFTVAATARLLGLRPSRECPIRSEAGVSHRDPVGWESVLWTVSSLGDALESQKSQLRAGAGQSFQAGR